MSNEQMNDLKHYFHTEVMDDLKQFIRAEISQSEVRQNERMDKKFATKADLEPFATKADLKNFATKADIDIRFAAIEKKMATKSDLAVFATKFDLAATEDRLDATLQEGFKAMGEAVDGLSQLIDSDKREIDQEIALLKQHYA